MEWTIFSSFKDRIHSDPSGLYADLEQAEQSVKRVAQQAAEKYGTERELHYQERVLKQNVGNLEQKLAEIKPDELLKKVLEGEHDYGTDVDLAPMIGNFRDAAEQDLFAKFVKDVPVTFSEELETATFEDLSSGYEAAVFMGVVVAERRGRREAQEVVISADLTQPSVLEADELVMKVDRDSVMSARRVDMDDQEDIHEKLIDLASDMADERKDKKG